MAIEDYLPNVFGSSAPSYLQGLLGAEETQKLQGRANVQGLLGAGLALAQGMSRTGPRRSAAENILGALAGGFGAAGGAYDQGIKNYVTQQQIAQTQLAQAQAANKLKSIQAAKLANPDIAYLADIDQGKFAEEVALRQRINLGGKQGPETPESLRNQAQGYLLGGTQFKPLADALFEKANRLELIPSPVSQPVVQQEQVQATQEQPVQSMATQEPKPGIVVTQAGETTFGIPNVAAGEKYKYPEAPAQVDTQTGEKVLPVIPVAGQRTKSKLPELNAKADSIRAEMDRLSDPRLVNNPLVDKAFANQEKRLEQVRKQIAEVAVSEVDLETFRNTAPPMFQGAIDNLMQLQMNGQITPDKLATEMREINKQITDFTQKEIDFKRKQADYSIEARRIAKNKFKKNLEDLTPEEAGQLDRLMFGKDKELRILGRTIVTQNVIAEKELTKGRAGAVVKAEETAFQALNTASDVRAIIDVLKPYQGGKLDEYKATIGSYLPNTSMAQIASAQDLAKAIRGRIAPTLRVEGSGSTSNFETEQFLSALPSLVQYAEGRELVALYTERLAERAAKAADLRAQMVQEGNFSIENFRREMKNQGLDRVFTNAELAQLGKGKAPSGGSTLPADVKKKYGIQD
jgi:hypothetical protein